MPNNLMLHCGSYAATENAVRALPEPEKQGPRHWPIHYATLLDQVYGALESRGVVVEQKAFGVMKEGKQFFGLLSLNKQGTDRFDVMLGLRSSIDKTLPTGIAIGSRVFVCDNLAFNGEVVFKTRNTLNILDRLPGLVSRATDTMLDEGKLIDARFDTWSNSWITDEKADHVLMDCVRQGAVKPSILGKVLREYDDPTATEHRALRGTKMGLFNAVTAAMRPTGKFANPGTLADRTIKLTRLVECA